MTDVPHAKPKRKFTPSRSLTFAPLSPHRVRLAIVRRLVKPTTLAAPRAWGRELAILKKLQARCPHETFWLDLQLPEQLDSLAWFLSAYGSTTLKAAYDLYTHAQQHNLQLDVDRAASRPMIEGSPQDATPLPPLRKPKNAIRWADETEGKCPP